VDRDHALISRLVTGAGGAALAVSVFLTWYSLNGGDLVREVTNQMPGAFSAGMVSGLQSATLFTITSSGWNAVHVIRFALLIVGLVALLSALAPDTIDRQTRGRLLLAGGLIVAALTVYRIASPPGVLGISLGPFQVQTSSTVGDLIGGALRVQAGPWVALIGSVLVMLGSWSQLGGGRERVLTGEPALPPYPIAPASKAPPGF
jgi:hypothetical protein